MARRKLTLRASQLEYAADGANADLLDPVDPDDPAGAVIRQIERLGIRILPTLKGRPATTFRAAVFFPPHFWTQSDQVRAAWARHELVHNFQWRQLGRVVFLLRYSDPRWRWALEVQAECAAMQTYRDLGESEADLVRRATKRAHDEFSNRNRSYRFHRLENGAEKHAREILLCSVGIKR